MVLWNIQVIKRGGSPKKTKNFFNFRKGGRSCEKVKIKTHNEIWKSELFGNKSVTAIKQIEIGEY